MNRITKFKQKAWLKPYIHMNTDLRGKAKEDDFFKLTINTVFGKTSENARKHRYIFKISFCFFQNQSMT